MMEILRFLCKETICMDIQSRDKKGVVNELIYLLSKEKKIKDPVGAIRDTMNRERKGSTGIGKGIAIPHATTNSVNELTGALGISKQGINFHSLDGESVHFIFLLLAPISSKTQYLSVLSGILNLLKDKFVQKKLLDAQSAENILEIIARKE